MFEKIKCFILDMDGTIYLGNELFSFTKDFLKKVEETGREYYFFTNNSSKSQRAYIEKLGKLGIPIKKGILHPHVKKISSGNNNVGTAIKIEDNPNPIGRPICGIAA